MKTYSIKDIAKLSGVSTATVSRVINNKGKYSEATKEKVLKVIKETDFSINSTAQSLRTKATNSIGILVPDISNFFFAEVVQEIEKELFNKGYSTIICNTSRDKSKEEEYLKMLEEKNVDGIIIISGANQNGFEFSSRNKEIPFICIDREPKNLSDTIFISSNHYQSALDATELLIKNGAKQPTIALHNDLSSSARMRLKGFKDALKKNGIKFAKEKNVLYFGYNEPTESKLKKHLQKFPEADALFAVNDLLAINLILGLKQNNITVPNQIQVIGFDNIPAGEFIEPSLSTMSQNTTKISQIAVSSILDCINDSGNKGSSISIPTTFVARNSTLSLPIS